MADSLVLKGVKDVRNHTGNEMRLLRPKRGGDTHMIKEWWKARGVNTCYVDCTIFAVTFGVDTVHLVLDSSTGTDIKIIHDGAGNFTFGSINEISRVALFNSSMQLIEHYVFPSISGGKIMTVTPPGAASKPDGQAPPVIGAITIAGPLNTEAGPHTYTANTDNATATQLSYTWTVTGGSVASGQGTSSITANLAEGNAKVAVSISASDAGVTDSPQDGELNVTVTAPPTTIGPVNITGETDAADGSTETYTVATPDATAGNLTYAWSVSGDGVINGGTTGTTVDIDWSTGSGTVSCTVTSGDSNVNGNPAQGTLSVTVS